MITGINGINWAAPTVSCHNRAVTESFGKSEIPGRDIFVICPGSCRVTEIQITSCPSKKEFFTHPISVICTGVVPARKSFLRLHFLIFRFSDFLFSEAGAKKRPERRSRAPQGINYLRIFTVMITDWETNFADLQANYFCNLFGKNNSGNILVGNHAVVFCQKEFPQIFFRSVMFGQDNGKGQVLRL